MNSRAFLVLLAASFALNGSYFMLVPIFPVHVTATLGLSAAAAGLVLAIRQFLQNAPMVLGGAIADRFSVRWAIVGALVIRALAFAGLAFATNLMTLTLAAVLAALSGSLFDAASRAAIAHVVPPADRVRAFGILSIVFVMGSSVGPLLGAVVFQQSFTSVCLVGAAWLAASGVGVAVLLPSLSGPDPGAASVRAHLSRAFADRRFVRLSLVSSGFWYLGSVLYIALPLHVQAITGRTDITGFLFSLYAALILLFQYPVISLAATRLRPISRLASGLAASGIGYLLMGAAGGVFGLVLALAVLALGRMLTEPTYNELVTELSPPGSVATYVGLGYLGLGIGGALGNLSGGLLFDLATRLDSLWVPWLVYGLLGLGLAVAFRAMRVESGRLATVSVSSTHTD
jgi:DHA1 family multidrug resistance protein-like MFS transporter